MKRKQPKRQREKKRRVASVQPVDYRLLITPRYDERTQRAVVHVAIRTVKEFSNFRYEVVVTHRRDDYTLHLDIEGLRAPELTFPGSGPATFEQVYEELFGTFDIEVKKLGKEVNRFRVHITPESVTVEEKPKEKFIEIVTSIEDW